MHLLPFDLLFYLFVCRTTKTKQIQIVIKSVPLVKLKSPCSRLRSKKLIVFLSLETVWPG